MERRFWRGADFEGGEGAEAVKKTRGRYSDWRRRVMEKKMEGAEENHLEL